MIHTIYTTDGCKYCYEVLQLANSLPEFRFQEVSVVEDSDKILRNADTKIPIALDIKLYPTILVNDKFRIDGYENCISYLERGFLTDMNDTVCPLMNGKECVISLRRQHGKQKRLSKCGFEVTLLHDSGINFVSCGNALTGRFMSEVRNEIRTLTAITLNNSQRVRQQEESDSRLPRTNKEVTNDISSEHITRRFDRITGRDSNSKDWPGCCGEQTVPVEGSNKD